MPIQTEIPHIIELISWNTGRGYSERGQRIAAALLDSGQVIFNDIDRGVDGMCSAAQTFAESGVSLQEYVMWCYDRNLYGYFKYANGEDFDTYSAGFSFELMRRVLPDHARACS